MPLSPEALSRAVRLELTLQRCFQERELQAMAVSCWNDVQDIYGICACSTGPAESPPGLL